MANPMTSPAADAARMAFNDVVEEHGRDIDFGARLTAEAPIKDTFSGLNVAGALAGLKTNVTFSGNERVAARPVGDMSQDTTRTV